MAEDRRDMPPHVKTADLPKGVQPAGWVFCGDCYGNLMTADRKTTDDSGNVCARCDGEGTLWRVIA